jgi:hypothetical protein
MVLEVTCEIKMAWLEVNRHHVGYLIGIDDTQTLLGQTGGMKGHANHATGIDDKQAPERVLS